MYALQFARRTGVRREHFVGDDACSHHRHVTGYYIWLAVSSTMTVVVDAGLDPRAQQPLSGFEFAASPVELLAAIGVSPLDVDYVILTHLHYDHTGTTRCFTRARCVVQRTELTHWSKAAATPGHDDAWLLNAADLAQLHDRGDHLLLIDNDDDIVPGLSAHLIGGHTPGMQVVRVHTASDPVVIASDASHFYENLDDNRPSPIVDDTIAAHAAFARIRELAGATGVVIPGHDPAVLQRHQRTAHPRVVRVR